MPHGSGVIHGGSRASDVWADGYQFGDITRSIFGGNSAKGVDADLQAMLDFQDAQNRLAVNTARQQWAAQAEADKIGMQFTHDENELAWQRQMEASNTAYQRAVAGMRKAGLNPVLALGDAASTPSSSGGSGISSARQAAQLNLDNVVASFKGLVRQLEQSGENARTAAAAQKYSATVTSASNLISNVLPFVAVRNKAR